MLGIGAAILPNTCRALVAGDPPSGSPSVAHAMRHPAALATVFSKDRGVPTMTLSRLALVAAAAWSAIGVSAGIAQAQQPFAAQPAAFDAYYYQPEAPPSPSDRPPPMAPAPDYYKAQAPYQAPACNGKNGKGAEEECEPWRLFCQKECGWNINGFINFGILANFHGPEDNFNGPLTFPDRDYGQFNQFYWITEKKIDTGGCGWDWGGRMDFLWGSDYIFNQATGLELHDDDTPHWNGDPDYGIALPQLYFELGYNDWSFKFGRFYTPIAYEVVPSTGNFFYSHAYTHQYNEPFTHTGVMATYAYSDRTSLIAGFVNGWDHFDREDDAGAGVFGVTWNNGEGLSIALTGIVSPNEPIVLGPLAGRLTNRNMYAVVVSYTFGCDDEWQYVFEHDNGIQEEGNAFTPGRSAEYYSVTNYLFYTINDCWKAGMRLEWNRDDDGARVTGLRPGNTIAGESFAGNFYEITMGLNWTPTANWTVRPELRYDWFDGESLGGLRPYDDGTEDDQWLAGLDLIFLW
jgi:hypothetical protein